MNVRFSSSMLARALREWCGHLAENKRMPDFVLYHKDIDILKAFITGYREGDDNETVDARRPEYDRASSTSRCPDPPTPTRIRPPGSVRKRQARSERRQIGDHGKTGDHK